ncbi:MAG: succinylglutamate desuccinylase/aspartoacylase family protein [Gammaproteobacteria bacterium]|nr:succinylglutamate desuccinylase/aspartoacylase family protein [Gammaproteobacteria bacterium]
MPGTGYVATRYSVYNSDLNFCFPGHAEGLLPHRIAAAVLRNLQGSRLVLDVHASNVYLREIPQVRLDERFVGRLLPLAKRLNVPVIWVQDTATVMENTLAYSLNVRGVSCLMVEMGVGMGLNTTYRSVAGRCADGMARFGCVGPTLIWNC